LYFKHNKRARRKISRAIVRRETAVVVVFCGSISPRSPDEKQAAAGGAEGEEQTAMKPTKKPAPKARKASDVTAKAGAPRRPSDARKNGAKNSTSKTKAASEPRGSAATQKNAAAQPNAAPLPEVEAPIPGAASEADGARLAKADPNLFVRPWVALWRRNEKSAVINLDWEEDHPTIPDRKIKASWRVTGDPELGLPTPGDRRLFNVLCEMTREQGLRQEINFTRYDVLKRLGRSSGKRDYELLLHSFERLKAVKITARNVFRDARTGLIEDAVFSIIDDVTIVKSERGGKISAEELPLSTFSWSDRIYNNIQNGFLLTFDLNIAQSLNSDVALVLYPLLLAKTYDGPGRRRSRFHSELRDFYENHLGMRSTPYLSKMEERLLPGHEELKQIGFLLDVRIEPMKTRDPQAPSQHKITYTLKLPDAPIDPEADALLGGAEEAVSGAPGENEQPDALSMAFKTPLDAPEGTQSDSPVSNVVLEASGPLRAVNERKLKTGEKADLDSESVREAADCSPAQELAPAGEQVLAPTPGGAEAEILLHRMVGIGVGAAVASQVLEQQSAPDIRLQLDCLGDRHPRDPAALFLYAVRHDLAPPPAFLDRVERERREAASSAQSLPSQQEAQTAAARARASGDEVRRQLGSATAFYEGLGDEAKALVRRHVSAELKQGGVKGRWQYPQPLWMEVLVGLLRDDAWRRQIDQMGGCPEEPADPDLDVWEHERSEPAEVGQTSLFARLDLYADTLREMIERGEATPANLDSIKERSFPLLDVEEWQAVKSRAVSAR
jgi:hypothetical protein